MSKQYRLLVALLMVAGLVVPTMGQDEAPSATPAVVAPETAPAPVAPAVVRSTNRVPAAVTRSTNAAPVRVAPAPVAPAAVTHPTNRAPTAATHPTNAAPVRVVPAPVLAKGEPTEIPMPRTSAGDSFFDSHVAGRFEVGTRVLYYFLLEDTSPEGDSFVGSVTMLESDQDYLPTRLFVQYKFTPVVGVGLSYDELGVEAWDTGGTDGTTVLSGPLLYLLGRYPNSTAFTPYGEIGTAFYFAKFEEDPGWGKTNNKEFVLDDPLGLYLALGCDWQANENWAVGAYSRYMNVDVEGKYMLNGSKRDDILFTSSNLAVGLGVKYLF